MHKHQSTKNESVPRLQASGRASFLGRRSALLGQGRSEAGRSAVPRFIRVSRWRKRSGSGVLKGWTPRWNLVFSCGASLLFDRWNDGVLLVSTARSDSRYRSPVVWSSFAQRRSRGSSLAELAERHTVVTQFLGRREPKPGPSIRMRGGKTSSCGVREKKELRARRRQVPDTVHVIRSGTDRKTRLTLNGSWFCTRHAFTKKFKKQGRLKKNTQDQEGKQEFVHEKWSTQKTVSCGHACRTQKNTMWKKGRSRSIGDQPG